MSPHLCTSITWIFLSPRPTLPLLPLPSPSSSSPSPFSSSSPTLLTPPTVTDLVVLPNCDFHPTYTSVHHVPTYKGIYEVCALKCIMYTPLSHGGDLWVSRYIFPQVFESAVYPPDNTWHKNSYRPDKGNKRVDSAVSPCAIKPGYGSFSLSHVCGMNL